MPEIGLCLGSNLGDRPANLEHAAKAIAAIEGVTIEERSRVYETEPVDVRPENRDRFFLNAVLIVSCGLHPRELLPCLRAIEDDMGRVRTDDRNAPRTVDIDILYAGDMRIEDDDLCVPHPHWFTRRFVVQPLAEVRPGLILPGQTLTVAALLLTLPDTPKVFLFEPDRDSLETS